MGRMSQPQRSSPRSKGTEPHIRLPSLNVLHQEEEHPESQTLKTSGAYIWEKWSSIGNRDFALKGYMQNLTCSESWHKGSSLKGTCVRLSYWSWRLSHKGKRQLGFPLGTKMPEADILGISFYRADMDAGKCHFGLLPLSVLVPGVSPTHQWAHSNCKKQGPTASWARANPAYTHAHSSWPHHNRRAHAAHIQDTLGALSSGNRGEDAAGTHRTSLIQYIKSFLQDQEM